MVAPDGKCVLLPLGRGVHRPIARLPVLLAPLVLCACTTLGPDFTRPTVPWLAGWSGGALRTLADDPSRSAGQQTDEWWRHFNDPVLDQLVAEAQRLNPGVRTAGMRILESRAQLGIAGSTLYPQLQQVTGEVLRTGSRDSNGNSTAPLGRQRRLQPGLGAGLLGQVQARHRVGRCRVLRQHRAIRRRPGPGGGAGGQPLRNDPHHRVAASHRPGKRRDSAAQPGDHRTPVSQRPRSRARRAAGPVAVPEHAGEHPRTARQPAPDTQRTERSSGTSAR